MNKRVWLLWLAFMVWAAGMVLLAASLVGAFPGWIPPLVFLTSVVLFAADYRRDRGFWPGQRR